MNITHKTFRPKLAKDDLEPEYVRSLLHYDPLTGEMWWRVNKGSKVRAGSPAGFRPKDGYRRIMIDGKNYVGTRLAWVIMTGRWPDGDVDHRDGNQRNDTWFNLRDAPHPANLANAKVRSDSVSGMKGVRRRGNRWHAHIKIGRQIHLGTYATKAEAAAARARAAAYWHGQYARAK